MFKVTTTTLRKLFTDSYNLAYAKAVVNTNKKSGEPVGSEVELEEFFQNWLKSNLTGQI